MHFSFVARTKEFAHRTVRMHRAYRARRVAPPNAPAFTCPCCEYKGIFIKAGAPFIERRDAQCPNCGAFERHRLQANVVRHLFQTFVPEDKDILHFAPEPFFARIFKRRFRNYTTCDISQGGVDLKADMRDLPLNDASFDFVFASDVIEYIKDDCRAIREIHRILRPSGIALLPVPVVCERTVEYPVPEQREARGHVRAPGLDYFDRYRAVFAEVKLYTSDDFPAEYQLHVYEDRTAFPTSRSSPLRPPMAGARHLTYVPVCMRTR